MDVTRSLARYVVNATYDNLPEPVIAEAKRSFLNWVGCAVGGAKSATVQTALAAIAEVSGPPQATLLGRAERLDMLHTALVNGMSSHVFDFDDTHLKTVIHPSGPVAAAILALAERRPVSGKEFLNAFVLGIEVECRIGNAVYPSHYDVGWHITSTTGVFGAAAAAGKLLGLDEQQMTWALGIAATQSSGLREMFGTMTKPFHPGRAAQNGLFAALLAQKGFTSSNQGIEAKRGFANVLSTARNLAEITDQLGERYEILLNTYKPFACGIVIHPVIDGCIQLRQEHQLTAEMIERIEVTAHPLVLELTGKQRPQVGLEGKFSVFHSAAVATIDGAAREAQYSDAKVKDPAVIALRDRVHVTVDPAIHEAETKLVVHLRDGRALPKHVTAAIGSVERPMSSRDLEEKFREQASAVLPPGQVEELIGLCWSLEQLEDSALVARTGAAR